MTCAKKKTGQVFYEKTRLDDENDKCSVTLFSNEVLQSNTVPLSTHHGAYACLIGNKPLKIVVLDVSLTLKLLKNN